MYGRAIPLMVLFVFLSDFSAKADTIPQYSVGFHADYGFIIPHSRQIEPVSHTRPYGIELNLNTVHASPESRYVFNAYWISGIQAGYYNFQNPAVLGTAYTLTLFAEPVLAFSDRFLFTLRGGAGPSYLTRIYNEITNPENKFFCTKISFQLYACVRLKYKLEDHVFLVISGNYNHISNGGFKQPNYGMNFPTLAAGIECYNKPFQSLERNIPSEKKTERRRVFYVFEILSALRVNDKTEFYPEKKSVALGVHGRVAKPLGQIYSLNMGAELIFDGYFKEQISREKTGTDYKRFALTAGQDFKFGKVFFTQYLGLYLYSPLKPPHMVYQKYELTYRFNNGLMTGVFLKAHLQEAEMMGFTLSWITGGRY